MGLGTVVFWAGLPALFLVAMVLRGLERDRMTSKFARHVSPRKATSAANEESVTGHPTPDLAEAALANLKFLHRIRRDGVEVAVWMDDRRSKQAGRQLVTVNKNCPECRDCMGCVNEAVRWIQEHAFAA